MKNRCYMALILIFLTTISYAAQPLWSFSPLTATTISITDGHTATIQYLVTNQSRQSHALVMTPITGITQNTIGAGICPNPFTLDYQQSCTLSLEINGSTLPENVMGGPVVCSQGSPLQCYQPSVIDQLNITKEDSATISLSGSPLTLFAGGSPGAMIITNTSDNLAALDITADFGGTALDGNVSISSNTCVGTLAPQASCTLTFIPGSTPVPQTEFPIAGSNTNTVTGSMTITSPHIIFVTNASYSGNLGGSTGANAKCNSDSAKPNSGFAAGYNYRALLNGNNATILGEDYYRTDGVTKIATAIGGNLVGESSLLTSISDSSVQVWTGGRSNNCSSWNSTSGNGDQGSANSSISTYWYVGFAACASSKHLYCVSQ